MKKRRGNFMFVVCFFDDWLSGVEIIWEGSWEFLWFFFCVDEKDVKLSLPELQFNGRARKKRYEMREKRKCGGKGGFNVKKICRKFLGVLCDFSCMFLNIFLLFSNFLHIEFRGGDERENVTLNDVRVLGFWAFRRLLTSPQYVKKKLHTTTRKNSP